MTLRIYQLPFILTLIAMPLTWLVSFSGIGAIVWTPELLALQAFGFLVSTGKLNESFKKTQIFIVLLFSLHLLYQVLSGQGPGGSAIISVALMAILFVSFFKTSPVNGLDKNIISQISIIYVIHISFILLELLLLNTGNTHILMMLSGGEYKAGLTDTYAVTPQSILKQSQAASQICVFAATWFSLLYFSRKKLRTIFRARHAFVLIASLLVFAVYPTTTAQIVGIFLLFSVVYLRPFFKNMFLRFLLPITGLIFFAPIFQALTYKMNKDLYAQAAVYNDAFSNPIDIFLGLPLFSQLWGVGSMESIDQTGVVYADFGIGVFILQVGIVLVSIATIALLVPVLRMLLFSYNRQFNNPHCFPWVWLGSANALLAVGHLLSLVHYTVALQMGGRALFSLHIAIVMFSVQQLVRYRRSLKVRAAVSHPDA